MYSIEKTLREYFDEKFITWKTIDQVMFWATDNTRWFTMSTPDIKKIYETKVSAIHHIPKGASEKTGVELIHYAYCKYYISAKRLDNKNLIDNYFTRSLKTAERIRDRNF